MSGKYYAIPPHMHSTFEGQASIRGHMYNAKKLGMEYMYITDHDFLMGKNINSIEEYSFGKCGLYHEESAEVTEKKISDMFELVLPYGFHLSDEQYAVTRERFENNLKNVEKFVITENEANCTLSVDGGKMCIEAEGNGDTWQKSVVSFQTSGYRTQHTYRTSLIRGVTVSFPFMAEGIDDNARVIFSMLASQQPPDFERAGIKYVFGNTEVDFGKNFAVVPVCPDESGYITLNVSEDAAKKMPGGLDNTFLDFKIEVEIKGNKRIKCFMGDIKIDTECSNEEALRRQRILAEKAGKEFGVTPIVTNEITAAGQHKISFCSDVPVIDHSDGPKNHEYAVKWVKDHGGEFSLNHPFFDWERVEMNECDKPFALSKLADEYIKNKCWGAIMLEVGFPEGRCHFSLKQHLLLWDKISNAGVFITGYGDSDNHACTTKWFDGNNFCAYIYSENPCEESFVAAMKAGNVFTGDPVFFKGDATFKTDKGEVMGSVIEFDESEEERVVLTLGDVPDDCRLVWVINGTEVSEETVSANTESNLRVYIDKDINFVRAELYNQSGRCIMLTNPIYFVKKGSFVVPEERKKTR